MEQIRNFEWAQDKIDEITASNRKERHEAQHAQRDLPQQWPGENRAQRRERQERRAAKKVKA